MLYTLIGRVIVKIFRGYFRYAYPNARRNLTIAGIAGVLVAVALSGARRRSASDGNRTA